MAFGDIVQLETSASFPGTYQLTNPVASGNTILAFCGGDHGSLLLPETVTDDVNGSYTLVRAAGVIGDAVARMFMFAGSASGSPTITFDPNVTQVTVVEVEGTLVDSTVGGSGTATATSGGYTLSTTTGTIPANSVSFGIGSSSVNGTSYTVNSPWVLESAGNIRARVVRRVDSTQAVGQSMEGTYSGLSDTDTVAAVWNSFTQGATAPTVANIDTDNAVNQYQQNAVISLTDFTETITSVTLNGVTFPIQSQVVGTSVTVDIPGSLDTGSYDLVVSGATETDTLSGVSYTQTHEYTAPYGLVDSNSLFTGIVLTENSYFRFVSDFANGTLDKATAESSSLWGNDIDDIYTPDGGFTGDDTAQIELLYDDGTTSAAFTVTVTVSEAGVDVWPYPLDPPSIPVTWDWGNRHPMTQSRVRLFKGGS